MLNPPRPYSETITKFVSNVLPFAALALVYVATQVSTFLADGLSAKPQRNEPWHISPADVSM